MVAYNNPKSNVRAIDVSSTSIEHTKKLKQRHNLQNLDVSELSLLDAADLKQEFDLIVSTGVLHHLPDPVAGGRALADILRPDGVMSLMLYGKTVRTGVYMLQEAFKTLELEQTQESVDLVRQVLASLPKNHSAHLYLQKTARDLAYDGAVVDTFLNPQDRAYSVAEVYGFIDELGLVFHNWMSNFHYSAQTQVGGSHPLFDAIIALPDRERAIVVDNLCQANGTHVFNLRRPGHCVKNYKLEFDDAFWSYTPYFPFPVAPLDLPAWEGGRSDVLQRGDMRIRLAPIVAAAARIIDGKKSVRACYEKMTNRNDASSQNSEGLFKKMMFLLWEAGHINFKMPKT